MITISVNGTFLDMGKQDVVIHSENFRFAGVLADPYTTDIEIPLTANNRAVLGIYDELSRTGQMHGTYVQCVAMIDGTPHDALLSVGKIRKHSADITLYLSSLLYETFDKSLHELLIDESTTILNWYNFGWIDDEVTAVSFTRYHRFETMGDNIITNSLCRPHPVFNVNYLLRLLSTAMGITIQQNALFSNLVLMASRGVVCPQNKHQYLYSKESQYITNGGQHITNDYAGVGSGEENMLTFDRSCDAYINLSLYQANSGTFNTLVVKNGDINNPILRVTTTASGQTSQGAASVSLVKGDTLTFYFAGVGSQSSVDIQYSNYTIGENDYDTPLVYEDHTNCTWFGLYANLPDIKIRDLINSLVWVTGLKPSITGNTIGWTTSTITKTIDAEIESVNPVTSLLGQKNILRWTNEQKDIVISNIASVYLDKEKVLHKSIFGWYRERSGIAVVPQYTLKTDIGDDGNGGQQVTYTADFDEPSGAVLLQQAYNGTNWVLQSPPSIKALGLGQLVTALEVKGIVEGDISDADYLIIEGRRFILVEADYTVDSRITEFTALFINPTRTI